VFVQLRPDASATAEELREFCRREIPERAAVPVQVALIPVMPVTGVGKIYKPALRLEAAQRAFEAAITPLHGEGVTATVAVRNDPAYGMLAAVRITASAAASREVIVQRCSELLGGFQIRHAVEFAPGAA
jgi:fatty-acyl-CoA synthase